MCPSPLRVVNLAERLSSFSETWTPKVVGELNGQLVKLAKLEGEFVWHHHEAEDELFLVLAGRLRMRLREGTGESRPEPDGGPAGEREVVLEPGEMLVVPRGVEHLPIADGECHVLLFEPASTLNTGNVRDGRTVEVLERL